MVQSACNGEENFEINFSNFLGNCPVSGLFIKKKKHNENVTVIELILDNAVHNKQ